MSEQYDLRNLLIPLTIVLCLTGFNLWTHRGDHPVGYDEYSGYDFSFEYPTLLEHHSWGYPDGSSPPTDFSGTKQVKRYWEGKWANLWVIWYTEFETPVLDNEFDAFYNQLDDWECVPSDRGELSITTFEGYPMLKQSYLFNESKIMYSAATALWSQPWQSLRGNRVYIVTYVAYPEDKTPEQAQETLNLYLASFDGNTKNDD